MSTVMAAPVMVLPALTNPVLLRATLPPALRRPPWLAPPATVLPVAPVVVTARSPLTEAMVLAMLFDSEAKGPVRPVQMIILAFISAGLCVGIGLLCRTVFRWGNRGRKRTVTDLRLDPSPDPHPNPNPWRWWRVELFWPRSGGGAR